MSILDRINTAHKNHGVFGLVGAERIGGKSTLAGTLPGRTLFLQASGLETGSKSAATLAARNGNQLDIVAFTSLADLTTLLDDPEIEAYDNLYVDSLSAVTELKYAEPAIQILMKKNTWDGFREIGTAMSSFILKCKKMAEDTGMNVFMTLGYNTKRDANGALVELVPACMGNKTLAEIKKLCPVTVSLRTVITEKGESERQMITKSVGPYPGRIDTLLDDENPGILPADLSLLLNLVKAGE